MERSNSKPTIYSLPTNWLAAKTVASCWAVLVPGWHFLDLHFLPNNSDLPLRPHAPSKSDHESLRNCGTKTYHIRWSGLRLLASGSLILLRTCLQVCRSNFRSVLHWASPFLKLLVDWLTLESLQPLQLHFQLSTSQFPHTDLSLSTSVPLQHSSLLGT